MKQNRFILRKKLKVAVKQHEVLLANSGQPCRKTTEEEPQKGSAGETRTLKTRTSEVNGPVFDPAGPQGPTSRPAGLEVPGESGPVGDAKVKMSRDRRRSDIKPATSQYS